MPSAVEDVFEVNENALSCFGAKKSSALFTRQSAHDRLEHQIEFAGFGQRAELFRVWAKDLVKALDLSQASRLTVPLEIINVFVAQVKMFQSLFGHVSLFFITSRCRDEDLLAFGFDPTTIQLIVSISFLGFPTVDHVVMEQVVVSGAFPNLRVHDDGAIEPLH